MIIYNKCLPSLKNLYLFPHVFFFHSHSTLAHCISSLEYWNNIIGIRVSILAMVDDESRHLEVQKEIKGFLVRLDKMMNRIRG